MHSESGLVSAPGSKPPQIAEKVFPRALRRAAEFAANEQVNAATALISTAGELNNQCWALWESFTWPYDTGDWSAECLGLLLLAEILESAE